MRSCRSGTILGSINGMDDVFLKVWIKQAAGNGEARTIREQSQLSREDVAQVLGVHQSTVYRWENGMRTPRGSVAIRYGRLLKKLDAMT